MKFKKLIGLGVKEWVICPPAGGPEDDVKEIFFEYLEALHQEDLHPQENLHPTKKGAKSAADLLTDLLSFSSDDYEDQLDANIRRGPAIIDLLLGILRS